MNEQINKLEKEILRQCTFCNKGKKSIQVDFRSEEGQELLKALITASGEDAG